MDEIAAQPLDAVRGDLLRSTGLKLKVRDEWTVADSRFTGFWLASSGGCRTGVSVDREQSQAERLVWVADQIQEFVHEELSSLGRPAAWPSCPEHPRNHPLVAELVDGLPSWRCPVTGTVTARIGFLADPAVSGVMIRRERTLDVEAVDRVHDEAFSARAGRVTEPTAESQIVRRLRADPGAWLPRLSLVMVDAAGVFGHVVLSRGRLAGGVPALALGPLAVRPGHQRRGWGTTLVHAAVAAADALDEALIVLLGDPTFYGRAGFVPAEEIGVTPPVPAWGRLFQARSLTAYDPAVHRGEFTYPPAFDVPT